MMPRSNTTKSVFFSVKCFLLFYLGFTFLPNYEASNILFFHASCTASHRISIWPLAEKLADSGHHVTYIYPISRRPGSHPKIEELVPSKVLPGADSITGNFDINLTLNGTTFLWVISNSGKVFQFCEDIYDSPEIIDWLSRPNLKIDLILTDAGGFGQCAYGLVHKFKAKLILFSTLPIPYFSDLFGVPQETSSVPVLLPLKPGQVSKSFWQRLVDTLGIIPFKIMNWHIMQCTERAVREKLKLNDMPSFTEIEQETSLVLHNSYLVDDYALSLPPMFVSFSGLHCTEKSRNERKGLPQEFEQFIHNSDGFVYVSFGSAVNMTVMPDSLRSRFFTAFESFPKLKFLWRWDGPTPKDLPKNVLLKPWYPQLDLLAHEQIKAFITQAGQPSVQEAICYAVPMIGLPIFGDQLSNTYRMEYFGAAVYLDITTLKKEELVTAIQNVVYTNTYKDKITELSAMYRDRPVDPLENAHFWVEYVLKYNTTLLKPLAMHQSWWQRRLLDVYAFIFILSLVFIAVFMFTLICVFKLFKYCCCSKSKSAKKVKAN